MADHICEEHQTKFFKTANMRGYSHPVKDGDGNDVLNQQTGKQLWCNEGDAETYHNPYPDRPQPGKEPLVAEAVRMGAKVTGVDNFKNRSMSVAYSKDLVCAGKIEIKQLTDYADKFLKYIENK